MPLHTHPAARAVAEPGGSWSDSPAASGSGNALGVRVRAVTARVNGRTDRRGSHFAGSRGIGPLWKWVMGQTEMELPLDERAVTH